MSVSHPLTSPLPKASLVSSTRPSPNLRSKRTIHQFPPLKTPSPATTSVTTSVTTSPLTTSQSRPSLSPSYLPWSTKYHCPVLPLCSHPLLSHLFPLNWYPTPLPPPSFPYSLPPPPAPPLLTVTHTNTQLSTRITRSFGTHRKNS